MPAGWTSTLSPYAFVISRFVFRHAVTGAVAALVLHAAPAHAQIPGVPGVNPFSVGVEAGPAFPVGDLSSVAKTGYTAGALVEARLPVLPVGLRFEGAYTAFASKYTNDNLHVISGTADAVLRLSPVALTLVRPYVLGGVGIYNVNQGGGTKAGINIGGGVSVPLVAITAFADVRYTTVYTSPSRTSFVPLHVGVRF